LHGGSFAKWNHRSSMELGRCKVNGRDFFRFGDQWLIGITPKFEIDGSDLQTIIVVNQSFSKKIFIF
jgi:hypothetical protein